LGSNLPMALRCLGLELGYTYRALHPAAQLLFAPTCSACLSEGDRNIPWPVANSCFTVRCGMLPRTDKLRVVVPRKGGSAARLFTAALIVAIGFAQFSASWHEASVRHAQCAEHGEAIDVGVVSNLGPSRTSNDTGMEGADRGEVASHDHCSVILALRASTRAQLVRLAARFEPPPVVVRPASAPAPRPGRAFVLASAPKTSPPSA
jgi:hypothetical protein